MKNNDLVYNGIIIINKPKGFTSHDVVNKVRGILKSRAYGYSRPGGNGCFARLRG